MRLRFCSRFFAYRHCRTLPASLVNLKCYQDFARDLSLLAILYYVSGRADPKKLVTGLDLSTESVLLDASDLFGRTVPAAGCTDLVEIRQQYDAY